ncbi:hypothetical protein QR680_009569 [Steinernema hermaphroditum]|uniref:Uncharacterized protein n=1 Tax=Steinernema hermaphroditum TaxID=289476 RepID=A0AA39IKU0_9BILA|nr:hypothetical protein QR680_009569 [Steinernema hermaphroditum]
MEERRWNIKRFLEERQNPKTRRRELRVEWEETNEAAHLVRKHCPELYEAFRNAEKNDFRILGVVDNPGAPRSEMCFAVEYVESGRRDTKRLSYLRANFKEKLLDFFAQQAQYNSLTLQP